MSVRTARSPTPLLRSRVSVLLENLLCAYINIGLACSRKQRSTPGRVSKLPADKASMVRISVKWQHEGKLRRFGVESDDTKGLYAQLLVQVREIVPTFNGEVRIRS